MRSAFALIVCLLAAAPARAQEGVAVYTQHCAECHESGVRAPARSLLAAMTQERIVAALETGLMRVQGEELTGAERKAVAAYLSPLHETAKASAKSCGPAAADAGDGWTAWGGSLANDRFQRRPRLTAEQIPSLKVKWAFGFDGETSAAATPTVAGDRVYIGSGSGRVYALGLQDGCLAWTFKADGGVRAAVVVGTGDAAGSVYVGDLRATVYKLDAATGELKWKRTVDDHRAARVTGSPVLHGGRVFVPVSSVEEAVGAQASYECCTFRGSVVALDAGSGEQIWKTYMIGEAAKPQGKNARGTTIYGPSGAAVWSSPTIDPQRNTIYIATGDSYSTPAAPMSDAVVALDLATGAIKWFMQATEGDAFNMACINADTSNCPDKAGPDHDFGQPPILVTLPAGKRALVIGQKSAVVHAFDPDANGRKLWSRTIGRGGALGGIEWGSASDGTLMYVPLSDLTFKNQQLARGLDASTGGGLFALRLGDGSVAWTANTNGCGDRPSCSPALSAPAAVIPGAVFAGSVDGHFRAYAAADGKVLWDVDTAHAWDTVNGVAAQGGSIDVGAPVVAGGVVLTTSGYGTWGGVRGNVLLAFSVDGR